MSAQPANDPTNVLRQRLAEGPLLVVPGAANALAARVIEDTGFEAAYVTGAGVANSYLGTPDVGLVTLTELTAHVEAIREAVDIPLVVDADTGFGNPINVRRTVRALERAGADAIQIEDQVAPKRCGHFEGKRVVAAEEMTQKVRAAVEARRGDTVVIARTDARAVEGFDSAVERARAYAEAGADVTFVEAPRTREEVLALPGLLSVPQLVNLVEGGRTPHLPLEELEGFGIALFANVALQGAIRGMQRALGALRETGTLAAAAKDIAPWAERQRVVGKDLYDGLDERYSTEAAAATGRT